MEGKREQKNRSERRAVVAGCGGRVPLIKLNFNHCQRRTQIPASQSANLRQMILLSFPATLGVGTAQILIKKKKKPVNYFPPASKSRTTKKVCVYVWRFCAVVFVPAGFGWILLGMCECKQRLGSPAVRSRATASQIKCKIMPSFILVDK